MLVTSDKKERTLGRLLPEGWITPGTHHPSLTLPSREKTSNASTPPSYWASPCITSDLTWGEHVDTVHGKAAQRLYFLTAQARRDAASQHAQGVHGSSEAAHRVCLPSMAHGTDGTAVRQAGEHSATGFEDYLPRTVMQRGIGSVWTAHSVSAS